MSAAATQYRVFFTNHGYFASESYPSLPAAVDAAKRFGFEAAIYRGAGLVASWGIIAGFRSYLSFEELEVAS